MSNTMARSRLRSWRLAQGFTLRHVSDLTGLSPAMLSRAERDLRRRSPHAKVLLAKRLRVRVADLFEPPAR
jgi:transcriptional regulator with XRE-family HTH domain